MNGKTIDGATSASYEARWQRHKGAGVDLYTVTPVFLIDGKEVLGEPSNEISVESWPAGTIIIVR